MGLLKIFIATTIITVLLISPVIYQDTKEKRMTNISFKDLSQNKALYYANQNEKDYLFQNGVVAYYNQTRSIQFAVIIPYPLLKGNLTDSDYILVRTDGPLDMDISYLQAGDMINVRGIINEESRNGIVNYYIHPYHLGGIMKTGSVNASNSDFQNLSVNISAGKAGDDWLDYWIDNVYLNPANGLSPLNGVVFDD